MGRRSRKEYDKYELDQYNRSDTLVDAILTHKPIWLGDPYNRKPSTGKNSTKIVSIKYDPEIAEKIGCIPVIVKNSCAYDLIKNEDDEDEYEDEGLELNEGPEYTLELFDAVTGIGYWHNLHLFW